MSNPELISFFDDANSYSKFEIIKKIYELTNNLDLDLLYDLEDEYERYCYSLQLKRKLEKEPENQLENQLRNNLKKELEKEVQNKKEIRKFEIRLETLGKRKKYINAYLKDNKRIIGDDDEVDEANILGVLKDLVIRKMSDLPKNSRHKNNTIYNFRYSHYEDIDDDYSHHDELMGIEQSDEIIDLSDTSIVGKIIYLEKLGIIDYLRSQKPFNTSVNSIATVLSAVTGAKATSIQPMLNPLLSKDVYNKNNPLNSMKKVYSIENILLNIGFEFNKKKKE